MIKFIKKIKDKIRKWNPKDGGTILLEQAIDDVIINKCSCTDEEYEEFFKSL